MPARIALTVESTGTPNWSSPYEVAFGLHRALLPAMRDASGFDQLHGKRLSLVIERFGDGRATARVGLPVDAWVDPVAESLAVLRARQTGLRISDSTVTVTEFVMLESVAIEALAATPPARTVEVAFDTVTVFSAGDRGHRSVADPRLIVRSWAQAWRAAAVDRDVPEECPAPVLEALGAGMAPIAGTLVWETATLGANARRRVPPRLTGFVGSLTMQLPRDASGDQQQWLSRLVTLAPYAGTGMKPQNGLGATRIAAKSADPSVTPRRPSSADVR